MKKGSWHCDQVLLMHCGSSSSLCKSLWLNEVNWKANLIRWDVLCSDSVLDRVGLRIGWKELSAVTSLHTDVEESDSAWPAALLLRESRAYWALGSTSLCIPPPHHSLEKAEGML